MTGNNKRIKRGMENTCHITGLVTRFIRAKELLEDTNLCTSDAFFTSFF